MLKKVLTELDAITLTSGFFDLGEAATVRLLKELEPATVTDLLRVLHPREINEFHAADNQLADIAQLLVRDPNKFQLGTKTLSAEQWVRIANTGPPE